MHSLSPILFYLAGFLALVLFFYQICKSFWGPRPPGGP